MNWPVHSHEAMATHFEIVAAHPDLDYARGAAAAAFRELDRLESELSRFVEGSDIARANRLAPGQSITIGHDTLECLLTAAQVSWATGRAFDPAYASTPLPGQPPDAPLFMLDPDAHVLSSNAATLRLDLGAVGKGFALDRMADLLREWKIPAACLNAGGSTVLALEAPPGETGWPVGFSEGGGGVPPRRLTHAALSASGTAVQGPHLRDPRTGGVAPRDGRVWALAPTAALSDALSTAFFVFEDAAIEDFCTAHAEIGAAVLRGTTFSAYGAARSA